MQKIKTWSSAELEDLTASYAYTPNKALADRYQCGVTTVSKKAKALGLAKAADFRDTIDFASFSKGVKPWNKGKKLTRIPEGVKKNWFKKGREAPTKDPEILARAVASRNETIRRDKLRRRYDLPPLTKIKLKNLD